MDQLLLFPLNALWQVAALALLALGLALVFGLLRVMNMAHGEFVMLGAYSPIVAANLGLPPIAAIPICLALVGLLALLIERLIICRLYNRVFDSLLATWALSILLREMAEIAFGRQFQNVKLPIDGTTDLGLVSYPTYRLVVILVLCVFFALLWVWYRRSALGLRLRAMLDNPNLAKANGINTSRLSTGAFVIGCMFAGLAGLTLAPTLSISPSMGLDALIRSFFALIVGGVGSLEGLMVGVTVIGGVQSSLSAAFTQTAGYLGVLVLSIFFIWKRPNGIISRH